MSLKTIPKPDFLDDEAWNNLLLSRDAKILATVAKAHVQQYIEAEGAGDTFLTQGAPTCLVTSIGRKTGKETVAPANFLQDGADVYIVGSIAGLDKHPNWALNLDATPRGWLQIKANKYPVQVHRLVGEERQAMWPRLTEFFPLWGHFQKYCDREFMVFRLSPSEK